jgi:uncharacterized membrane protein
MLSQLQFLLSRLRERLWIKPLIACILSVAGVLLAHAADDYSGAWDVPEIPSDAITTLLKIVAASMLGVATFAVASMVSAYASTDKSATARAFPLIVADDVSQNALSTFVAAFIFSVVALSAMTIDYYGKAGRCTLFILLLLVLVLVVLVFVRWVDRIARLGRLGAIMAKVEDVAAEAVARRMRHPCLGGVAADNPPQGLPFYARSSGYLQRIDMAGLQRVAAQAQVRITLAVVPGTLILPSQPLGYVLPDAPAAAPLDPARVRQAFVIGRHRQFDDDPDFGLAVLAEIACRALSPGVNDPGTAIGILDALYRLLATWAAAPAPAAPTYARIAVPLPSTEARFDTAWSAIGRDGAGLIEVAGRLQRVLGELARCADPLARSAARRHAALALERSAQALTFAPDLEQLRRLHAACTPPPGAWRADASSTARDR